MITHTALAKLMTDPDKWLGPLNEAMREFQIHDASPRAEMFLAQIAHESAGFIRLIEDLHYSANGLLRMWPRRFTPEEAQAYAYDDERIANRAYANRYGNGDEASGDGWRFRGRGLLQHTFRGNYYELTTQPGFGYDFMCDPDLLLQPEPAARCAAWYWQSRGCNELADREAYGAVTMKIAGGLTGIEDRMVWLHRVEGAMA